MSNLQKIILSTGFVLFASQIVFAHAHLIESQPKKDEIVHQMPTEVRVKFSEDLEFAMSKIEVQNAVTHVVVSQAAKPDETSKDTLVVLLKPLNAEKTNYQVSWKAVTKDSHIAKGKYNFSFDPGEKK